MLASRRRRRTFAVLWVALLAGSVGAGGYSLANFVAQNSTGGDFTSGTVTLGLTPASAVVSYAGMVPGNQVAATLTLQNAGTGALRYSMVGVASNPDGRSLGDVIDLTIERRTGCGGAVLETLFDGSASAAAFGDPRAGTDPGDRSLAPATAEILCVRATLPADTDPLYASSATTLTFTFSSEQTASNP